MTPYLECKNLSIGYGGKPLISGINLKFEAGEFIGLIGPNGSGKSTFVKTLMNLLPKISGKLAWQKNLRISYVPQKLKMNPQIPLSVRDFLNLKPEKFSQDWLTTVISMVKLEAKTEDSIHALSGGQLQRLFIAYALLSKPKFLILDEATEGMDIRSLQEVFSHLKNYIDKENACLIYITHDISAVNELCTRVLCLHQGVAFDGSPQDPHFHQCLHSIYGEKATIHDHRH